MERKNILYAEDNEGLRKIFLMWNKALLPEVNLEIFEDGNSLEKRLQKGSSGVDMVIMDNDMPISKGSDIIKKYTRTSEFRNVPFVLYYGGSPQIGEQSVKDGAKAYFLKGTDPIKKVFMNIKGILGI